VRKRRWFLPESPDLVGALRAQLAITIEGVDAFAAWAGGDASAATRLIETEDRADTAKREVLSELQDAFITPLEPEDLFALSRGIDRILEYARDLVREAIALRASPDGRLSEMAKALRESVGHIDDAVGQLGENGDPATSSADAAIGRLRSMERIYYEGMAELLDVDDRTVRISNRELYRRCARIAETVIEVAERIVYSVVKES
jgi:uncharacterized protein Yka (UPF0111/DUF47 family)